MKKTGTFGFRISEDTKAELNEVSPYYGLTGGQLITLLVERFLDTHKKFKGGIVWPPHYVHVNDLGTFMRAEEVFTEQKNLFDAALGSRKLENVATETKPVGQQKGNKGGKTQ